jgi:DNA polymerase-3 subunit alpha
VEGFFLQLRGNVCERFKQKDNWEFKITSICLLSDLRDKMSKCLTIQLPLLSISDELIRNFEEIFMKNAESNPNRNCGLKFQVMDYDNAVSLEMPLKNVKVFPSNEFLSHLREINNITYKLN